jgi:hypothetical protein
MRKIMQWMMTATLVCGISVFTSCSLDNDDNAATSPDGPHQQLADYTIIYYGNGGGDLDKALMETIAQFYRADAESRKNVNICVQYKFSTLKSLQKKKLEQFYPYAGKTCRFTVPPKTTDADLKTTLMTTMSSHFFGPDNADFCRSDSLANYINWATKQFPARKYILILNDHGGGYLPNDELPVADVSTPQTRGVIYDDGYNDKHFTAKTLAKALSQSREHLSALYMDACIMNTAEYQFELAPLTDYFVLSTCSVPDEGGYYAELVQALSANPDDLEKGLARFAKYCVERWDNDKELEKEDEEVYKHHDMNVYRATEVEAFGAELKKFVDCLLDTYRNGSDEERAKIDDITAHAYRIDYDQPSYDLMHYVYMLKAALPDVFGSVFESLTDVAYNRYIVFQQSSAWLNENGHTVSLSVLLGCQGHYMTKEDGKDYRYDADGMYYLLQDGELLNGRSWGSTLDETYGQLRFDKATGWSRWLRLNQQEPNLKCFVDLHNFNSDSRSE